MSITKFYNQQKYSDFKFVCEGAPDKVIWCQKAVLCHCDYLDGYIFNCGNTNSEMVVSQEDWKSVEYIVKRIYYIRDSFDEIEDITNLYITADKWCLNAENTSNFNSICTDVIEFLKKSYDYSDSFHKELCDSGIKKFIEIANQTIDVEVFQHILDMLYMEMYEPNIGHPYNFNAQYKVWWKQNVNTPLTIRMLKFLELRSGPEPVVYDVFGLGKKAYGHQAKLYPPIITHNDESPLARCGYIVKNVNRDNLDKILFAEIRGPSFITMRLLTLLVVVDQNNPRPKKVVVTLTQEGVLSFTRLF